MADRRKKPLPAVDDLSQPFWQAARQHRLVVQRCRDCHWFNHPPRSACDVCQSQQMQFDLVSRRRTLLHYALDDYMACGGSLASKLWSSSGLGPQDIDAAELYDGFSPSALYWLEAAGFCPPGEAYTFIQDGRIALEGELPVNTFGGSLSEGRLHGMGHIAEAVFQVTGRAGKRQIPNAATVCAIDGSPMLRGSGLIVTKDP